MFKDRLRETRKKTGLSQRQFAKKIGLGSDLYNKYEQGVSRPSPENLVIIANALDCTTDYLLGRKDTPSSENEETPPLGDGEQLSEIKAKLKESIQDFSEDEASRAQDYVDFVKSQRTQGT